jgi:hypothetical protein
MCDRVYVLVCFQTALSIASYIQLPFLAASRADAVRSLGSRIRKIIRLSGSASIIGGTPPALSGSLIPR